MLAVSKGEFSNMANSLYAAPRFVDDASDCYFYHTMEIPGYGLVRGEWDLREGVREYLGGVDFKRKRVLELGTASGFLCFHMEKEGAEVIAYDLSEDQSWDVVPFARGDTSKTIADRKEHIRKLNNGFWFTHRKCNSKAKVVYGNVYSIPQEIGPVDIAVLGSILLHVRDPFLALQNALRLTRETVIVTDVMPRLYPFQRLIRPLTGLNMSFVPRYATQHPWDSWWRLSPELITEFMGVLGFETVEVKFHRQQYEASPHMRPKLFTIIGHRTL
jgi:SAM-dependent methyltransferase